MYSNQVELLALRVVLSNGNVNPLVELGYAYSQIVEILEELKEKRLLASDAESKLVVTELGKQRIKEIQKSFGRKNSELWIEPEYKSKIDKLDENELYLPLIHDKWYTS